MFIRIRVLLTGDCGLFGLIDGAELVIMRGGVLGSRISLRMLEGSFQSHFHMDLDAAESGFRGRTVLQSSL